jgi:multidrug efflux system membrane fusion protein
MLRIFLRGLVGVFLLVGLVACESKKPAQEPLRAVKVMTVGESTIEGQVLYAGEVKAKIESRLGFRIAGKLIQRHVELGQRVQAGQLLAEIDPQDYKLALDAIRAQLQSAQTNRDLALADFKRYKDLKEKEFISGAELERRETTLKSAQAQFEQMQAQVSTQTNQLNYAKLVADRSGIITAIEADAGQIVTAGMPIVRLALDGPREVIFSLPEDRLNSLKTGQVVQVKSWSNDQDWSATIRDIAASADPVTRTFTVKLTMPEKDAPALGSTVTVMIQRTQDVPSKAILLPTIAIRQENNQSAVWVLDETSMTVQSQGIQIATASGNQVLVASGLKLGQKVVVAGVHVLSPGQKVKLYQERSNQTLGSTPSPQPSK